jgi:hypothetical protein
MCLCVCVFVFVCVCVCLCVYVCVCVHDEAQQLAAISDTCARACPSLPPPPLRTWTHTHTHTHTHTTHTQHTTQHRYPLVNGATAAFASPGPAANTNPSALLNDPVPRTLLTGVSLPRVDHRHDPIRNVTDALLGSTRRLRHHRVTKDFTCAAHSPTAHAALIRRGSGVTLVMSHLYTRRRFRGFVKKVIEYCTYPEVVRIVVVWHFARLTPPTMGACARTIVQTHVALHLHRHAWHHHKLPPPPPTHTRTHIHTESFTLSPDYSLTCVLAHSPAHPPTHHNHRLLCSRMGTPVVFSRFVRGGDWHDGALSRAKRGGFAQQPLHSDVSNNRLLTVDQALPLLNTAGLCLPKATHCWARLAIGKPRPHNARNRIMKKDSWRRPSNAGQTPMNVFFRAG